MTMTVGPCGWVIRCMLGKHVPESVELVRDGWLDADSLAAQQQWIEVSFPVADSGVEVFVGMLVSAGPRELGLCFAHTPDLSCRFALDPPSVLATDYVENYVLAEDLRAIRSLVPGLPYGPVKADDVVGKLGPILAEMHAKIVAAGPSIMIMAAIDESQGTVSLGGDGGSVYIYPGAGGGHDSGVSPEPCPGVGGGGDA